MATVRTVTLCHRYAFRVTRGHLHAIADRSELYVGLAGKGVMILETLDGATELVGVVPGHAVCIPGHWVNRSVNVGEERFRGPTRTTAATTRRGDRDHLS
jgi:oxalate decarboxylase/phosphoglucose isomerase-like protein (cupin superfamily)